MHPQPDFSVSYRPSQGFQNLLKVSEERWIPLWKWRTPHSMPSGSSKVHSSSLSWKHHIQIQARHTLYLTFWLANWHCTEGHPRFPDFQAFQQFYFCRSQSILLPNVQNSPTDIITQTNLYSLFSPYLFASKLRHLCPVFILNKCLKKKLFSPWVQLFSIAKCLF